MGNPYHWRDLAVVSLASKAKAIQYKTVVHRLKFSIVVDIKSPRGKYSVHSFIHNLLDVLIGPAYSVVDYFEQLVPCRANVVPHDAKTELVKSSIHSSQCRHASPFLFVLILPVYEDNVMTIMIMLISLSV